ncbi:hypothetical protein QUB56_01020, partial [Microcoleus sp. AR_TQ3_B6]|uniref:hypothetical protein n=1 Tax=Microcoleus sp. AR_TQ3_B6 TaxID=3055284 RepID=UPI002FD58ADE
MAYQRVGEWLNRSQKPGESETGFLTKISVRCQNYRRNPVSGIGGDRAGVRNRVSHQNFGEMPKLSQKPGFWD